MLFKKTRLFYIIGLNVFLGEGGGGQNTDFFFSPSIFYLIFISIMSNVMGFIVEL